ncbi:MAG: type II secretion system protein [Pirellulales bacterium]
MRRDSRQPRWPRGLTLVELLVAMSIVGILAAMAWFALRRSQESAREAKTRALIAKLHTLVLARWESYQTRRVPIDTAGMALDKAAMMRLKALRELMVMEMPDRWSDVSRRSQLVPASATASIYARRYQESLKASGGKRPTPQYQSAECLYLIVTAAPGDDGAGREQFLENEIGDADDDGWPEFHDAWGRPISFLRFAPGFRSDLQSCDGGKDHDPFDTRRVDRGAFALYPLVYSAGPDGVYDIHSGSRYATYEVDAGPYAKPSYAPFLPVGEPYDEAGDGPGHLDNIHNHLLGTR